MSAFRYNHNALILDLKKFSVILPLTSTELQENNCNGTPSSNLHFSPPSLISIQTLFVNFLRKFSNKLMGCRILPPLLNCVCHPVALFVQTYYKLPGARLTTTLSPFTFNTCEVYIKVHNIWCCSSFNWWCNKFSKKAFWTILHDQQCVVTKYCRQIINHPMGIPLISVTRNF